MITEILTTNQLIKRSDDISIQTIEKVAVASLVVFGVFLTIYYFHKFLIHRQTERLEKEKEVELTDLSNRNPV